MIMMGRTIRNPLKRCYGSPELLYSGTHLCPIILISWQEFHQSIGEFESAFRLAFRTLS
jgi:hypothetical protein